MFYAKMLLDNELNNVSTYTNLMLINMKLLLKYNNVLFSMEVLWWRFIKTDFIRI